MCSLPIWVCSLFPLFFQHHSATIREFIILNVKMLFVDVYRHSDNFQRPVFYMNQKFAMLLFDQIVWRKIRKSFNGSNDAENWSSSFKRSSTLTEKTFANSCKLDNSGTPITLSHYVIACLETWIISASCSWDNPYWNESHEFFMKFYSVSLLSIASYIKSHDKKSIQTVLLRYLS